MEVIQCFAAIVTVETIHSGRCLKGKLHQDAAGREPGKRRIHATVLPPKITLHMATDCSVSPSVYQFPPWKCRGTRKRRKGKRKVNELTEQ